MSKLPRRRHDTRPAELLDAALAMFADKGFTAARMEDIAARAGAAKGTLYLYFPSKEAVFEALVRTLIVPLTHFLRIVRGVMLKGNGFAAAWPNLWPLMLFLVAVATLAVARYQRTLD